MKQLKITQQITRRESRSLEKYLQEVSRYHPLTPEEEVDLAFRIREGDNAACEALVKANLRFVISVAKQYQHLGLTLEDLINEGNIGLVTAAERFDPTRGFKFISYAVWWIRQAILKAAADHARTIRLPANQIARLGAIRKAGSDLQQSVQREPTAEELADMLDLPEDKVSGSLAAGLPTDSLDRPVADGELTTLGELLVNDDTPDTDAAAIENSLRTELNRCLSVLTRKEREVIAVCFGLDGNGGKSLKATADDMGVSSENVRQIRERALAKLRRSSGSKQLRAYLG